MTTDPIENAVDQVLARYVAGDVLAQLKQELLEVLPHAFAARISLSLSVPSRAGITEPAKAKAARPRAATPAERPKAKAAPKAKAVSEDGKNPLMAEKKTLFWARKRVAEGKAAKAGDAKLIAKWDKIEAKEAEKKAKAEAKAAAKAAKAAVKAPKAPRTARKKADKPAAEPAVAAAPSPLAQAQARRNGTTDTAPLTVVSDAAPL